MEEGKEAVRRMAQDTILGVKIKVIYDGETGQNPHSRGLDHQDGLQWNKTTIQWKHCTLEHEGEKVEIKMNVLRSFKLLPYEAS